MKYEIKGLTDDTENLQGDEQESVEKRISRLSKYTSTLTHQLMKVN